MSAKILIVEDEFMISEDLAMIISGEGYTVVGQAFDGTTALDMLHSRKPDIVLLDISLAHAISGLDIAAHINEKYQLPFIFITSFSDKKTLDQAKILLPQGYIVKPFKRRDVLSTLEIVAHRIEVQNQRTTFRKLEEINKNLINHITKKEYEILIDISKGLSNDQIGAKHLVTLNTVKSHLKKIFTKLDITSRTKVAAKVYRS